MIIFGTRGVTYSGGNGSFFCPSCGTEVEYKHKRCRRFFTLYFIPVIPLDLVGEYVECGNCRSTYRMEVLEFDPSVGAAEFEAEYHRAIKTVMIEMMLADGKIDDEEINVIRKIYSQLTKQDLTDEQIEDEVALAHKNEGSITDSLTNLAGGLNDRGKEMVVTAAFMVAAADGEIDDTEKALFVEIGQALGMSGAHFQGVLQQLVTPQSPQP